MDLVEFLRARLDEDEGAAKAGSRRVGMPWRVDPEPWDGDTGVVDDYGRVGSTGGRYAAEHIARHDPARVLREVAAKRAIIAAHKPDTDGDCYVCLTTRDRWKEDWPLDEWPCHTILVVAAVYSDHPDYNPAWAAWEA